MDLSGGNYGGIYFIWRFLDKLPIIFIVATVFLQLLGYFNKTDIVIRWSALFVGQNYSSVIIIRR